MSSSSPSSSPVEGYTFTPELVWEYIKYKCSDNIIEFWDRVLCKFIPQLEDSSWFAWRVALKAIFALPMTPDELELFKKCTNRSKAPERPPKTIFLLVGRRGGKSRVTSILGAFTAVFGVFNLSPGERGKYFLMSQSKDQASTLRNYTEALFTEVPYLGKLVTSVTAQTIELNNGHDIEIIDANDKAIRGYTVIGAVGDEVAFWNKGDAKLAERDKRVNKEALRPAMMTTGGRAIYISSPYAKSGIAYEAHVDHFGVDDSDTLVWMADTLTMNPGGDVEEIEAAFKDDPEAAWSEYGRDGLIKFRDDVAVYVPIETVMACVDEGRHESLPKSGTKYEAFVDPSGGSGDSFTLAIGHVEAAGGDDARVVIDCVRELVPPFNPDSACSEYAQLLKQYKVYKVTGDRYAGEWPVERFAKYGIEFEQSAKSKSELYIDALSVINTGRIRLVDNDKLVMQISKLERRTARGGRDTVDHPPKGHDDLANVVAGVAVELGVKLRKKPVSPVWGRKWRQQ